MEQKNHRLLQCALEIMKYISKQPKGVSFKEICTITDLPKSSVHNLVQTMCNMNFLQKKENYNEYRIGLQCFEVGNAYLSTNPFYSVAKDIVENVSIRCNQTTHFGILNGHDTIYLYKFDSNQPLRIVSHTGKRIPAHATAIGKALLSGLSKAELDELYRNYKLEAITEHTITSLDELEKQIEEVRKTHIAYEAEESSPYVRCIAVPICNRIGNVIAALSVSFPIYQNTLNADTFKQVLFDAKRQLEAALLTLDM
ncbi:MULTISPECIES: IclR family transcriptional regulator [Blautia]|uniref:IclR family transcriptional regulator n=1 Tax=Blautia ammoniilytica TaxID=2981782 RepID=A0ABT2TXD1_9FIRM|nr:IclR family transcriptional regulator [Blautia ammoniilytica]MCU6766896.1 IclR family transcriptional regulator [Blautia ammoniilytica]SCI89536.1 Pectin degradation repressor protein kdgR [uncultured Blautia sp.]